MPITKQELKARLQQIVDRTSGDTESDHADADEALLDYVDDAEILEIYESIGGWYA